MPWTTRLGVVAFLIGWGDACLNGPWLLLVAMALVSIACAVYDVGEG